MGRAQAHFHPAHRNAVEALYHLPKTLDSTRPVIGIDGWEASATDIPGIHDDDADPEQLRSRYETTEPQRTLFDQRRPAGRILTLDGFPHCGQPIVLTEFGGIAYDAGAEKPGNWGYSRAESQAAFLAQYRRLREWPTPRCYLAAFATRNLPTRFKKPMACSTQTALPRLPWKTSAQRRAAMRNDVQRCATSLRRKNMTTQTNNVPNALAANAGSLPTMVVFCHLRWDFVYQRPQQLLSRLAQFYRILVVEEPFFHERKSFVKTYSPCPNITVIQPHTAVHAPGFHDDQIAALQPLLTDLLAHDDNAVLWFYTPMALPLLQSVRPSLVVYDCMDELSAFKNAPQQLLQRESALLKTADIVFTGGPSLYQAKRERHPNAHCFSSGVDIAHVSQALERSVTAPIRRNCRWPSRA